MNTAPTATLSVARDMATCAPGVTTTTRTRHISWRSLLFRTLRLLIAGALLAGIAMLARDQFTNPSSDLAYLNAEITSLRAPISGEARLERLTPGMLIRSGEPVFRMENQRIGNDEAHAQTIALQDIVDRLRAESTECSVAAAKQQEIFGQYDDLYARTVIARVVWLEQEQKASTARTAHEERKKQLTLAEARLAEAMRLAALQHRAAVTMPFDGVVWSVHQQQGGHVGARESVVDVVNPKRVWVDAYFHERQADRFCVGAKVLVRTVDGREKWRGRVETVRAGVGRLAYEHFVVAAPPGDIARRRIEVRVALDSGTPFPASEFFGIGRSVIVTPDNDEN